MPLWYKWQDVKLIKFTNAASKWSAASLLSSPRLLCCWRVSYSSQDREISPKKPLWFLKDNISLKKGECIRIL